MYGAKSSSDCVLKQNSSTLLCAAVAKLCPGLLSMSVLLAICLFIFSSFSFYLDITLMCVAGSRIVPRVAVSLISIEGDEKFATKHKVSKLNTKI